MLNKSYISVGNDGCATLFDIPYGYWRQLDEALSINQSTLNGMTIEFKDLNKDCIERLLKRSKETCELFQIKSVNGWKKLLPECQVSLNK